MAGGRSRNDDKKRKGDKDLLKTRKIVVVPLEEGPQESPPTQRADSSAAPTIRVPSSAHSPSWVGPPSSDQWQSEDPTFDRITERSIAVPAPPEVRRRATLTV